MATAGDVGETSLSCDTVLKFVEAGKRMLLVNTDPAPNLDEVLEDEALQHRHVHLRSHKISS
jgi:anion-transporting  ArsA/GET3 family ATPase